MTNFSSVSQVFIILEQKMHATQEIFIFSKSIRKILEKGVKYV